MHTRTRHGRRSIRFETASFPLAIGIALCACSSTESASPAGSTSGGIGGASTTTGATTGAGGSSQTSSSTGTGPGASTSSTGAGGGGGANGGGGGMGPGGLRWIGRIDASDPSAAKFAWSGAGLVATVTGTDIEVNLETEGGTTSAFFQPVVDGKVGQRFQIKTGGQQKQSLASGLAAGPHSVELYRDSEGSYGDTVFRGFTKGTVTGAPAAAAHYIEVVGDSISAGYGNLGVEVHPPWDNTCTFSLDTEAAYQSYASVLARTLDAEVSIIARSGWGMYRDLGGSTSNVLSSIYGGTVGSETMPAWDFVRKADAVVINLGTNDSALGDPGKPYEDAYVAFLKTVRGHYPNAWIFLTIGPMTSDPLLTQMQTHLANVVTAFADAKVVKIDIPTQDATSTGCDYHPNVAEDKTMAAALAPAMKSSLGW